MRGEQIKKLLSDRTLAKSPPLARGTDAIRHAAITLFGITPACAGNSPLYRADCSCTEDHPRLRGEQTSHTRQSPAVRGSPPLARGTVICGFLLLKFCGITPACAGNSDVPIAKIPSGKDHPRLRGEQPKESYLLLPRVGSPPLARGTEQRILS